MDYSYSAAPKQFVKDAVSDFYFGIPNVLYLTDITEIGALRNHTCLCDRPALRKQQKKSQGSDQGLQQKQKITPFWYVEPTFHNLIKNPVSLRNTADYEGKMDREHQFNDFNDV